MGGYSAQFGVALCARIGAPASLGNLEFLSAWATAEGGTARWNPLNTTWPAPGASNYNAAGVKNYSSAAVGLAATVSTLLENGGRTYAGILSAMRNDAGAIACAEAVAASPWGTGAGVLAVLARDGSTPTTGDQDMPLTPQDVQAIVTALTPVITQQAHDQCLAVMRSPEIAQRIKADVLAALETAGVSK